MDNHDLDDLAIDADIDLRLMSLWQLIFELGDVFDDDNRNLVAMLMRFAYDEGFNDGGRDAPTGPQPTIGGAHTRAGRRMIGRGRSVAARCPTGRDETERSKGANHGGQHGQVLGRRSRGAS